MDAAKIRILVEANSSGVAAGLMPGAAAITSFERNVKNSIEKLKTAFTGLSTGQKLLGGAAIGVGLLGTALVKSIRTAIEFESAWAGVRKTVDGTPEVLANIRQGLLDMSSVSPTTAAELADIAANAGQLGVKAPDILEFTRVISMLGETTDLSFDEAAQSLARFLNITGGGPAKIGLVADVIVELGNNSATTESQIVAMATRMASSFTIAGATEQEILALAATFSSLGIEAEAGGTAAAQIITVISDAAKLGGPELQILASTAGLLPAEFAAIAEATPVEALLLFTEGLGKVIAEGESITPILDDLELGGIRVGNSLRVMALNGDLVRNSLALAEEQVLTGGAAYEEYAKRVETTESQLAIFENRLNTLAVRLGTPLLAGVVSLVDGLGDGIIMAFDGLAPLGEEVSELFSNIAEAVGLFYAALGSPLLKTAAAALLGLSYALTGLLDLFNALGSTPILIGAVAAAILSIGPAAIIAASGTSTLAGSFSALGASLLASGPLIVMAAGLALVGKAAFDSGQKAKEAADKFKFLFDDSIKNADFGSSLDQIETMRARVKELDDQLAVSDFTYYTTGVRELLNPFEDNSMLDAATELKGLKTALEESGAAALEWNVGMLAESLGVSRERVLEMANATGTMNQLMSDSGTVVTDLLPTMRLHQAALEGLSKQAVDGGLTWEEYIAKFDSGEGQLSDMADQFGILGTSIEYLAEVADIDMKDLLAAESWAGLQDVVIAARDAIDQAGAALGIATDEFIGAVTAVDNYAASLDDLNSIIDGTKSALDRVNELVNNRALAQTAFDEGLAGIKRDDVDTVIAAASAMRDLTAAEAASGIGAEAAARSQQEHLRQLVATGEAAGYTKDEIIDLAVEYGLIPEAKILEISLKADQVVAEANAVRNLLEETAGGLYEAELTAVLTNKDQVEDILLAIETFDTTQAQADAVMKITGVKDLEFALGLLARLQNKTVVIGMRIGLPSGKTVDFTGLENVMVANGAVFYAAGGMSENHIAQIAPAGAMRVWAEPETGGESYIPHAADARRPRALAIWRRTGEILGALKGGKGPGPVAMATGGILGFARGGIATSFKTNGNSLPSVLVDVTVDAAALGQLAIDLRPINNEISKTARTLDMATGAADTLSAEFAPSAWDPVATVFTNAADAAGTLGDSAEFVGRKWRAVPDDLRRMADMIPESFRDALDRTEALAGRAGFEMARALRPDQFLTAFSEISGWAKDSFRDWLGDWDGTVESAVAKLYDAGLEMDHIWAAFDDRAARSASGMVDVFQRHGVDLTGVMETVGSDMLRALRPEEFLATFSEISGWGEDAFVDWLAAVDTTSVEAVAKMREAGVSIGDIFAELFSNDEALERLADAGLEVGHVFETVFRDGVDDVEVMDFAIGLVTDSVGELEDASRRADDAFRTLTGAARDTLDAQLDMADAIDRVKEAVDEGEVFSTIGEEARRNYQDLLRAGDAMREYALTIAGSGISAADAVAKFRTMRDEFRRLALDAGLPQAEVEELVRLLFNVPEVTIAQIAVEGQQAMSDIEALDLALVNLSEDPWFTTVLADSEEFEAAVGVIRDTLSDLETTVTSPDLGLDSKRFDLGVMNAKGTLDELTRRRIEVQIGANLAGFETTIAQLAPTLERYGVTPRLESFAAGDVINGHQAQVARGLRVWAEPETGGESYIPHANDWRRPRALSIWRETGNILGAFAAGGLVSGLTRAAASTGAGVALYAPVEITVHAAPGMSEDDVGRIVGRQVTSALAGVGRDLSNMR